MTLYFIRVLFVLLSLVIGYQVGGMLKGFQTIWNLIGVLAGFVIAAIIILCEFLLRRVSLRGLSAAVFGLLLALITSRLITGAIDLIPMNQVVAASLKLGIVFVLCYLGMIFAIRGRDEFNLIIPYVKFDRQNVNESLIILDTSVIIDGRIADICQTKFIEGRFVIPRFVLKELQQVADSADPLKRNRGRRGLDILNKLRKTQQAHLKIQEEDFPDILDVDAKLVKLAKVLSAKILTNDYNLNKIAELQGVAILNINELANTLRPVVLPGELMEVKLIKEGKEYNQGVAYLDDGTMVVVDNGKRLIGQTARVIVTSVLQTAAGRMIFAKYEGEQLHSGTRNA